MAGKNYNSGSQVYNTLDIMIKWSLFNTFSSKTCEMLSVEEQKLIFFYQDGSDLAASPFFSAILGLQDCRVFPSLGDIPASTSFDTCRRRAHADQSPHGRHEIRPQGSRLMLTYGHTVATGELAKPRPAQKCRNSNK